MDLEQTDEMFRPPINRAMHVLDRSFFRRTIPLSAASIFDAKFISQIRETLLKSDELFRHPAFKAITPDDTAQGRKCVLLNPNVKHDGRHIPKSAGLFLTVTRDPATWSSTMQEMVDSKLVGLRPYTLEMNYDHWSMRMYVLKQNPWLPHLNYAR